MSCISTRPSANLARLSGDTKSHVRPRQFCKNYKNIADDIKFLLDLEKRVQSPKKLPWSKNLAGPTDLIRFPKLFGRVRKICKTEKSLTEFEKID